MQEIEVKPGRINEHFNAYYAMVLQKLSIHDIEHQTAYHLMVSREEVRFYYEEDFIVYDCVNALFKTHS